jgi:hypothetical protein
MIVSIWSCGAIKIVQLYEKSRFIWQGINDQIDLIKKTVQAIHGIRAIRVRASEVWLYLYPENL